MQELCDFTGWLKAQRAIQDAGIDLNAPGAVPQKFESEDQRREMLRWNVLAAMAELMEALEETPWKPWSRDDDPWRIAAFESEILDALKFIGNALFCAGVTPDDGKRLGIKYVMKGEIVVQRWREGYRGRADKCPGCGRDLSELPVGHHEDDCYKS